jgi:hypothetical protein
MTNPNLSEIITTTLRNRAGEIRDNVSNKNALLSKLKETGAIKQLSGGRTIVKPLDYAENNTYKRYSGYESLDITPSDVITSAEYDWKQASVSINISGRELRENSGKEAIINLLEAKIKNAIRTMSNKVSEDIYSDGTADGGKQIGGLQSIIADDPTTGIVGGINSATFSFWRNQVESVSSPDATNITSGMNLLFNKLVRGSDRPKIIVADSIFYNYYESSLQANQRFTSDEKAGAGFTSLAYKGNVPVILDDSGIPASRMYFLNTDYLSFEVHKDAYMTPREAITPVNQDSIVQTILLQGNLCCSNRALQGVLKPA